jgi:YVTN family beta-propeller protein
MLTRTLSRKGSFLLYLLPVPALRCRRVAKGSQHPLWSVLLGGCLAIVAGCVPARAQSFAYVPNGTTVSVIDTRTNTVVDTVPGLGSPFGVALTPNGSFAYITNFQNSWVSVIDRTNTVVATVPGFNGPFGIAVAPNGAFAYVVNLVNDSVGIINTATNVLAATVPLPSGSEPVAVAITPNSATVYVSDQGANAVSVISSATNAVIATVPVGPNPAFLAITPNGAFVYVTNFGSTTVSVISTATNSVVATVPVGTKPVGVAIRPDGAVAYVTNSHDNTVSVISTATNTVTDVVPVGNGPNGVAFTGDGAFAYVVNLFGGTVSVIETANRTIVATIPIVAGAQTIAISPADNDSQFAQLSGANTFNGNQTVNGVVSATSFVGDGSGLTGIVASSANIANLANYATSAGDAATLGGNPASAFAPATGSPSYVSKAGDTMTGTLNLAANGLRAGGNQLVLSGGNVGIGTTSPEGVNRYTSLHIDNALTGFGGSFLQLSNSGTGFKSRIVGDPNGLLLCGGCGGNTSPAPVRIKAGEVTSATDSHIYILTNGNVGIGTVQPAAKLDVNGTVNFAGLVTFAPGQTFPGAGSGTITGITAGAGLFGGGTSGNVTLTNSGVLSVLGGSGISSSGGQSPTLSLNTGFTDSRYVSKSGDTMTGTLNLAADGLTAGGNQLVLYGGNMGIGTATPEGVSGYTSLHIDNAGSGFGGAFLQLTHSASNNKARIVSDSNGLLLCSGCGGGGALAAPVRIKAGEITTGTDSHIFIVPNGNVGIGTVTPAAKLDVNGTANFSGLVTFASGQTFPGTGNGTITGVTPGTGLSGGGTSGNVNLTNTGILALTGGTGIGTTGGQTPTLSLNTSFTDSRYAQLGTANTFTANQTVPNLTVSGTVSSSSGNFSGSTSTQILTVSQNGSGNALVASSGTSSGAAVSGTGYYGVHGLGTEAGVRGDSNTNFGVVGSSVNNAAIFGIGGPWGVVASGSTAGVWGQGSGNGTGLYGSAASSGGTAGTFGVFSNGKILSGQNNNTEVFSVASDGSVSTSGKLNTVGSVAIGSGTPIVRHISVLFSNVTFNTKLSPTTCTGWSGTIPGAADGDTVAAGLSSSLMSANIVYSAWATNGGMTIRICNPTGSPTTVGAGNIRVDVWKH